MLPRAKYVEIPHANGLNAVAFAEHVGTQFVFGHGVRAQHQQGPFSLPDQNILFIAKEVFEAGDSTVSSSSVAHRHQFQVESFRQEVRLNLYLQEPALQSARGLATLRGEASQARYRHARTFFVQHVTGFQLSSSGESHLPLLPKWHRLPPLPFIALCTTATRNNALRDAQQRVCQAFDSSLTAQQVEHDANAFDTTCGHDANQARQRPGVDLHGIPH